MNNETTPLELTLESFRDLADKFENKYCCGSIHIGTYEGNDFAIFESWEAVESFTAYINGFEGLKGSKPYLREGETLNGKYVEACKALEADPANWHLKSVKETCLSHFLYSQYLAVNNIDPISIDDFGIEWGFSDEYDMCCHCYSEVVRTSPDSYSWTPPLFLEAEGYVCDNCAPKFKDYVLEEYCNVAKNIPEQFDPADLGLVKINEDSFENGWHGGQCDEPTPIIEALNAQGVDCWFRVYPGQFDLSFDVYVKAEDSDKATKILAGTNTKAKEDPATVLERGLRAASTASAALQGEGVKYTKINADGTATARLVSNEEFIKGIKD